MARSSALLLLVLLAAPLVTAWDWETPLPEAPEGTECRGKPNTIPAWDGELTFVKATKNGKLYHAGDGEDRLSVVHVYGTPYEMGYAQGELLHAEINSMLPAMMQHLENEVESVLGQGLPASMESLIAREGLAAALGATYEVIKPYTREHQYLWDEMHGLADATGIPFVTFRNLNMLPELIKAGCSMMQAWDSATKNGAMWHLRSLDFDMSSPLQNAPTVTIYHPNEGNGHAFANVGWAGFTSSITGVSSAHVGISEKHSDLVWGEESRAGYPFNFMLRDILQFDSNVLEATTRMSTNRRTCSIFIGVSDGLTKTARIFPYSYSTLMPTDGTNNKQLIPQAHFEREHCHQQCYDDYYVKDANYWGVRLGCWQEQMQKETGNIDAATAIRIASLVGTGNLHSAIYDVTNLQLWVSNARAANETGPVDAFDRQFVHLDVGKLFEETL
eukprot:PLAT11979.1.p2 GENE.PLAT11979.1~~PLAT11979.1.p2  ORF type:complete len:455 (+),score=216.96 PLAT11979.1:31-1365(+)